MTKRIGRPIAAWGSEVFLALRSHWLPIPSRIAVVRQRLGCVAVDLELGKPCGGIDRNAFGRAGGALSPSVWA
jgi:hypothetical protein